MAKKLCRKCKEIKPCEEFSIACDREMGRASNCKVCAKACRQSLKPKYTPVQLELPL